MNNVIYLQQRRPRKQNGHGSYQFIGLILGVGAIATGLALIVAGAWLVWWGWKVLP